MTRYVVLTGAGISAESGLSTFRDAGGLWEGHDPMAVATPEAFEDDPAMVHRFYDERRRQLGRVRPNAAHEALARLEAEVGDDLLVVTQNVDDLHERAGSRRVLHMHGALRSAWCLACDDRVAWEDDLGHGPACPGCGEASLRPDVVWFGEIPYGMERIERELADCEVFCSIGTSGQVYPAAAFVHYAIGMGAQTIELNMERTGGDFHQSRQGPAGELVPRWVEELLSTR